MVPKPHTPISGTLVMVGFRTTALGHADGAKAGQVLVEAVEHAAHNANALLLVERTAVNCFSWSMTAMSVERFSPVRFP